MVQAHSNGRRSRGWRNKQTKQSTHHVYEIDRNIKRTLVVIQYQRDSKQGGKQLPVISDRMAQTGIALLRNGPQIK
jgi:hypothetical protein